VSTVDSNIPSLTIDGMEFGSSDEWNFPSVQEESTDPPLQWKHTVYSGTMSIGIDPACDTHDSMAQMLYDTKTGVTLFLKSGDTIEGVLNSYRRAPVPKSKKKRIRKKWRKRYGDYILTIGGSVIKEGKAT
jgi:hypothetical protein